MIRKTEYKKVNLKHIMRSSSKIAEAANPKSLEKNFRNLIQERIEPGSSSTVPGTRPRALVYKYTDNYKNYETVNYEKLATFLRTYLRTQISAHIKITVLCDLGISARRLGEKVKNDDMPVSCYDGGVETFNLDGSPMYRGDTADERGEAELTEYLEDKCSILLTHSQQFSGCESDAVILVTRDWGVSYRGQVAHFKI